MADSKFPLAASGHVTTGAVRSCDGRGTRVRRPPHSALYDGKTEAIIRESDACLAERQKKHIITMKAARQEARIFQTKYRMNR
ncbi:MAG: hypothetical protein HG422_06715 [Prevotella sp.]|nr:hypothetical protein [Prevotella sp.]